MGEVAEVSRSRAARARGSADSDLGGLKKVYGQHITLETQRGEGDAEVDSKRVRSQKLLFFVLGFSPSILPCPVSDPTAGDNRKAAWRG